MRLVIAQACSVSIAYELYNVISSFGAAGQHRHIKALLKTKRTWFIKCLGLI